MRGVGGGGRTRVGARAGGGGAPWLLGPAFACLAAEPVPEARGHQGSQLAGACKPLRSGGPWADSGPDSCFIGPENVLRIFKDEVITHKNPDFSLCLSNPKVLAAPGLHIPGTRLGAEFQRLLLGVWVGDPLSNSRPSRYGWGD